MSEHLSVLEKGKVITSLAAGGEYHLAIHDKDGAPDHFLFMGSDKAYTYEEYCGVLRGLWESYLSKGEKPKLLGLTLSDEGFVTETLHCIAPGAWSGQIPLLSCRESFTYWLKSRSSEIRTKLGENV